MKLSDATLQRMLDDEAREKEFVRVKSDLWYLLTEYLGRGFNAKLEPPRGLTLEWHKPVCEWLDYHRAERKLAIWCKRGWHKTTIEVGLFLQEILGEPCHNHRIWTGSPQLCEDLIGDFRDVMRNNDKLRSLDPAGISPITGKAFKVFPAKQKKFSTFQQGSGSIDTYRPGSVSRGKTIRITTAGTEATGSHVDGLAFFDDIIGLNTIERSGLQGIADWVRLTAFNVVDSKRFRSIATPWSDNSIHQEWMEDDEWLTLILPGAISESHGDFVEMLGDHKQRKIHMTPCYKFTQPTFWPPEWDAKARKELRLAEHDQKGHFPQQTMCDSSPASARAWAKESCEHFTGVRPTDSTPGTGGSGRIFVLGDPAPYHQGGFKGLTEKRRGDGTKDYWSFAVWKLRPRGAVMDAILLDGSHSQEWTRPQGCDEAARLMRHWKTNLFFSESADDLHADMIAACLREGTSLRRAKNGGPHKFKEYNKADGKNSRFLALSGKAEQGEVWISETCPDEFLYGDKEHTGFLTQARKLISHAPGKNNLLFDDDVDICSRVTDPALLEFAPRINTDMTDEMEFIINGKDGDAENDPRRSRYCGL